MSRLPISSDILVDIFSRLSHSDVTSSISVCRQFHDVINSNRKQMKKMKIPNIILWDCSNWWNIMLVNDDIVQISISKNEITVVGDNLTNPIWKAVQAFFTYFVDRQYKYTASRNQETWKYKLEAKPNESKILSFFRSKQYKKMLEKTFRVEIFRNLLYFLLQRISVGNWLLNGFESDPSLQAMSDLLKCIRSTQSKWKMNEETFIGIQSNYSPAYELFIKQFKNPKLNLQSTGSDQDLKLLDTNYWIDFTLKTENCTDMRGVETILQEWREAKRNIRNLTIYEKRIDKSHRSPSNKDCLRLFIESINDVTITDDNQFIFIVEMRRTSDRMVLVVKYLYGFHCNRIEITTFPF